MNTHEEIKPMAIYTLEEAAKLLRITKGGLYNLNTQRKITVIKGRPAKYWGKDLITYLNRHVLKAIN